MEENEKKEQQFQIDLKPEVAAGSYANLAMINHSSSEFVVDFAHMLPGVPPTVTSRIILAPEHAKRLLAALHDNVARYEAAFGAIKLPEEQAPQGGRTIAPFETGKA